MNFKNQFLTYLIVDDEDLARADLCRQIGELLPSFTGIEAATIRQARERLLRQRVDGVFLDLEMPDGSGMALLSEIRAMGVPVVVITAHPQYAVGAFDGDAVDYLLKPVEPSRLARALTRIRKTDGRNPQESLIMLGDQSSCWPLRQDEIVMVESDGKNVLIHVKNRAPISIPRSLKEIEDLLNESQFVRVNRYRIVQLLCLKEIRRCLGAGYFVAELDGHGTIEFSRRQSIAFRQRFGF